MAVDLDGPAGRVEVSTAPDGAGGARLEVSDGGLATELGRLVRLAHRHRDAAEVFAFRLAPHGTGIFEIRPGIIETGMIDEYRQSKSIVSLVPFVALTGTVVGSIELGGVSHPFVSQPGEPARLFAPLGSEEGIAWDINDDGWVVGGVGTPGTHQGRAFRWRDGASEALPAPTR